MQLRRGCDETDPQPAVSGGMYLHPFPRESTYSLPDSCVHCLAPFESRTGRTERQRHDMKACPPDFVPAWRSSGNVKGVHANIDDSLEIHPHKSVSSDHNHRLSPDKKEPSRDDAGPAEPTKHQQRLIFATRGTRSFCRRARACPATRPFGSHTGPPSPFLPDLVENCRTRRHTTTPSTFVL